MHVCLHAGTVMINFSMIFVFVVSFIFPFIIAFVGMTIATRRSITTGLACAACRPSVAAATGAARLR